MSPPVVTPSPASPPTPNKLSDLEIKDAQLIFGSVWQDLEADFGRENLRFPKEIILLGGAPGSGKGTNTAFITRSRGLTCAPVVISALLDSPEAKALKDAGIMVGDREPDFDAARALGWPFVWRRNHRCDLSRGEAVWEGEPDHLLSILGLPGIS